MSDQKRINKEKNFLKGFRYLSGPFRTIPDFFIIGTGFCAKTQLYNHLIQHPQILSGKLNETSYFDLNYSKGINWYRSNFPTIFTKKLKEYSQKTILIGETLNIPNPKVPFRINSLKINPRAIAILRNPVDRTYARYLSTVRAGKENLPFDEAIELHKNNFSMNSLSGFQDESLMKNNGPKYNYLYRGIYIKFISKWLEFFQKEKLLVLSSEELFTNPLSTTNKALQFLGLSDLQTTEYTSKNLEESESPMNNQTRKELIDFFKPYNDELFKLIEKDFGWNNEKK